MKKKVLKTLILSIPMILQYRVAFASDGVGALQNFLNTYVVGAGRIVCIFGAMEICFSFASNSIDKRINALKIIATGIVMTCVNNIINTILK